MSRDPRFYDPAAAELGQHPVPSQQVMPSTPYLANEVAQSSQSATPFATPQSHVEYVFDTRPGLSQDFNLTFTPPLDGSPTVAQFQVPPGYVCILRSIDVDLLGPVLTGPMPLSITGIPLTNFAQPILGLLTVNGMTVPHFGEEFDQSGAGLPIGWDLSNAGTGYAHMDLFVLANPGDDITFQFDLPSIAYVSLSGTLLQQTGRDLVMEATDPSPVPVTIVSASG